MTAIIETTSIAPQREKDAAGDSPRVTSRLSSGIREQAAEQIAEPAEEDPCHVDAGGEECQQLDHRFDRDRRQQAALRLREVGVSRAEEDPEEPEHDRHQEGGIEPVEDRFLPEDHLEGLGHRLELKRDVRDQTNHNEAGHQRAERRRLAVPARDEVRDGRDPLLLGDSHEPAQEQRPEEGDEGRAEIDRQELKPPVRRQPHAAVEGPRRAVDRRRQDVGEHLEPRSLQPARALRPVGDPEQEQEVPDDDREERAVVEPAHRGRSLTSPNPARR